MIKFLLNIFVTAIIFLGLPLLINAASVTLDFSGEKINLIPEKRRIIDIKLDPGGNQVIGVDMVVLYDPRAIRIVEATNLEGFSTMTAKIIDNQDGVARIAVSNEYGKFTTNASRIVRLLVEPISKGVSIMKFDFTPGKTNDTNVVIAKGVDVLTNTGEVTLRAGGSTGEIIFAPAIVKESIPKDNKPAVLGVKESGGSGSFTLPVGLVDSKTNGKSDWLLIIVMITGGMMVGGGVVWGWKSVRRQISRR